MKDLRREDILEVLACDIDVRPTAPTVAELAPLALNIARNPGVLTVEFPADARTLVQDFAAAEQQCCAGIGWEVLGDPILGLQVTANEAALDVLHSLFTTQHSPSDIDNSQ